MTTVGVLGESVALDAVRVALSDAAAETVAVDPEAVGRVDVAALAGPVGATAFERATTNARETRTPLVSIELGGVGGKPVTGVEAAVSGYAPGTACYACLRSRVEAADPETDDGAYDTSTARFAGAVAGHELAALVSGGIGAPRRPHRGPARPTARAPGSVLRVWRYRLERTPSTPRGPIARGVDLDGRSRL